MAPTRSRWHYALWAGPISMRERCRSSCGRTESPESARPPPAPSGQHSGDFTRRGGGGFGHLNELKHGVDSGLPSLVIVRPTDFRRSRWFDLHYRVVVGYEDSPHFPGGGRLLFACSSSPMVPIVGGNGTVRANVAVDYWTFDRQWRTWATWHWFLTLDQPGG